MIKHILVAGATGRTGQIIVKKLCQHGVKPHVLVRDISSAQKLFGEDVIYHQGDVREIETIFPALPSIDVLISAIGSQTPVGKNCPKRVDYEGIANLVKAACQSQVDHFILISSIAVTHPEHPLNCFGKVLNWKLKGEEVLRQSGLNYTIIRPGGLKDTPGGKKDLVFDQGDQIMGTISRSDLAEVCLNALEHPQSECTTFEVIEADKNGCPDWTSLFSSLSQECAEHEGA